MDTNQGGLEHNDRAILESSNVGFCKISTNKGVAHRAGEMINEVTLTMKTILSCMQLDTTFIPIRRRQKLSWVVESSTSTRTGPGWTSRIKVSVLCRRKNALQVSRDISFSFKFISWCIGEQSRGLGRRGRDIPTKSPIFFMPRRKMNKGELFATLFLDDVKGILATVVPKLGTNYFDSNRLVGILVKVGHDLGSESMLFWAWI